MAEELDVLKLAGMLCARFEFPKAKLCMDRDRYTMPFDALHAKIVTPHNGVAYLLDEVLERDTFPRNLKINGFDLGPFIGGDPEEYIAVQLADHYDDLLLPTQVLVVLPGPPELAGRIKKKAPASARQLHEVKTFLVVTATNYFSTTPELKLSSLFTPTVLEEAWKACLTNSDRGYDLLGDLKHF